MYIYDYNSSKAEIAKDLNVFTNIIQLYEIVYLMYLTIQFSVEVTYTQCMIYWCGLKFVNLHLMESEYSCACITRYDIMNESKHL